MKDSQQNKPIRALKVNLELVLCSPDTHNLVLSSQPPVGSLSALITTRKIIITHGARMDEVTKRQDKFADRVAGAVPCL